VGKTFTVLALSEVGDAPCGYYLVTSFEQAKVK